MHDSTEMELIRQISQGHEIAFQELYSRWQAAIYRFAWQMTGSSAMAEDITQDVFVMIIKNQLHFDPSRGSFASFIYGVARNLCLRSIRKNERFRMVLQFFETDRLTRGRTQSPLQILSEEERAAQLRHCILSLPPKYREILVLCELHEFSYSEAANITGSSIGTIRSRLHRGRDLLLQKMRALSAGPQESKGGTPYEIQAL